MNETTATILPIITMDSFDTIVAILQNLAFLALLFNSVIQHQRAKAAEQREAEWRALAEARLGDIKEWNELYHQSIALANQWQAGYERM